MVKRIFDFSISAVALLLLSPIFLITMIAVWLQDYQNPFYIPLRMGRGMKPFKMYKFRSMVVNADKTGVTSTAGNDKRVTVVGRTIRKFKLDELSQLINVFLGDMSLVGPRPQVVEHVLFAYTEIEKELLEIRPGITDISSIVFSDEGDILKDEKDPDIAYNQLIRPGKSLLGIFYKKNQNILLDIRLVYLTILAIISKEKTLTKIVKMLNNLNADPALVVIASRKTKLLPTPPPGAKRVVTNREGIVD